MGFWSPCLPFGMYTHRALSDFMKSCIYLYGSYEINRMCYIYYLQQTLKRNSSKEGCASILGVQDMPNRIFLFIHQD